MALTRPFPADKTWPNAVDIRRELSGLVPHEGVFPDPTSLATAGLAYAGTGWGVNVRAFVAALRRQSAAFVLTHGTVLLANDAIVTNAWTLPAAPVSGSQIHRLWVEVVDPTQGGALTTPAGETVPRAVPRFGITSGVAATTPVAPALPTGVLELAQVTIASTNTSAAQAVFSHTYPFAAAVGDPIYVRNTASVPAFSSTLANERYITLDNRYEYRRNFDSTNWALWESPWVYVGAPSLRYRITGGAVEIVGTFTKGATYNVFTLPTGFRPGAEARVAETAAHELVVPTSGVVQSTDLTARNVHFSGVRFFPA